ncbi:MAG: leucine-rich repeat domain-containing protein [Lachnospiraceae bacterium]|nr:leucine-rich repeat domain-containing protein [Lachnospiraceae bacterium]
MFKKILVSILCIAMFISGISSDSFSKVAVADATTYELAEDGTGGTPADYTEADGEMFLLNLFDKNVENVVVPKYVNITDWGLCPVTGISPGAFRNNKKIKTISLPYRMKEICNNACRGCVNLQEMTFPARLERLDARSFMGCRSMKKITFEGCKKGSQVTELETGAFQDCTKLTKVNLPCKLKYIGEDVFKNCNNLKKIVINCPKIRKLGKGAFEGVSEECKVYIPKSLSAFDKALYVLRLKADGIKESNIISK